MAFFKFRKSGDGHANQAVQPESVESMRRRAMHRLIGAVVLVVAGVIGFPMLFDSQPRPIAVDIPIDIPDKNKSRPVALPVSPAAAPASPAPSAAAPAPVMAPMVPPEPAKEAVAAKPESKTVTVPTKKQTEPAKPAESAAPKAAANDADAAKAQAVLEGRAGIATERAAQSTEGRFVVQVGAFADTVKAKEVRTKLERAGLKTYTQVVETKDGSRTRVRVGPFTDKADAESSASKIKALDLPASILVL